MPELLSRPARWLILPIETKVREFEGKLLLAAAAAERGWHVLLGDQNELLTQIRHLPRGLYLDKSVARTKTAHFRRLKQQGFAVAAWCEEGLVYLNPEIYLSHRVAEESLAEVAAFLAWGPRQWQDMTRALPAYAGRIVATGNPRGDVLRPELRALHRRRVDSIRDQHGRFLLINTSFARYNHQLGDFHMIELQRRRGIAQRPEEIAELTAWCEHIRDQFGDFVAMLPELRRRFPEHRLIVRPHPSENFERWRRETADLENVEVRHEGPTHAWLLAADAMVHAACSTGFESYLMGRPAVSYRPHSSALFDAEIPLIGSHRAATPDELETGIRAAMADAAHGTDAALAAPYVDGLSGDLAVDRILDVLEDVAAERDRLRGGPVARLRRRGTALRQSGKRRLRALARARGRDSLYAAQKFPGLDAEEVTETLETLRQACGRFEQVRLHEVSGLAHSFALAAP